VIGTEVEGIHEDIKEVKRDVKAIMVCESIYLQEATNESCRTFRRM